MTKHGFTLVLGGDIELTLCAAGCDDGSPGMSQGIVSVDFHREGESLQSAIRAAIADVNAAGASLIEWKFTPTLRHQRADRNGRTTL